jgi:hypothetical protein
MPLPTPTDEDIDFVREVTGEVSFEFISTLIDKLNDAQWSRALELVAAWNEYAPGSVMELVNGGREGVNEKDQDALEDIRRRLRLLLGLPEVRDISITGGFGTVSVPVLWVW